mmetsp:Transcript_2888/g.4135  ORF Transcript_2888/g.4135 Transcript_2888/m.4135 type:complete len:260 (+) Transcript_2888:203-982(+)
MSLYKDKLSDMIQDAQCHGKADDNSIGETCSFSSILSGDMNDSGIKMEITDIPLNIMSARTLEQSLKGASSYLEAARRRRMDRSVSQSSETPGVEAAVSVSSGNLSVSFSAVEIREYEIQMGDNPSVSSGPPLTIAWDYFNEAKIDIDVYEANCPDTRNRNQILLPYKERWRRLAEQAKLTDDEIFEETKKVNVARRLRAETISNLDGAQWEERMEKIQRWMRNLFRKKLKLSEKKMIRAMIEMDRRERERRLAVDLRQ